MHFPLLSLPAELRLRIYDYMLNSPSTRISSPTRTPVSWIGYSQDCFIFSKGKAHEVNSPCPCSRSGSPWLPGPPSHLSPAILAACRSVYTEALPRLYESRVFLAANFRTSVTQHEACLERWWILDRFLASLSEDGRKHVRTIRLPMLLSLFETYGCAEAFRSINLRLPRLRLVEVEVIPTSLLDSTTFVSITTSYEGGLGVVWPVMEFRDTDVKLVVQRGRQRTTQDHESGENIWEAQQRQVDSMRAKRWRRTHGLPTEELEMLEDSSLASISALWNI